MPFIKVLSCFSCALLFIMFLMVGCTGSEAVYSDNADGDASEQSKSDGDKSSPDVDGDTTDRVFIDGDETENLVDGDKTENSVDGDRTEIEIDSDADFTEIDISESGDKEQSEKPESEELDADSEKAECVCDEKGPCCDGCMAVKDGIECEDDNPCTKSGQCENGRCVRFEKVVCKAIDDCHIVGTCNKQTGKCSNPKAPNKTACDSGKGEDSGLCEDGVCKPIFCDGYEGNHQCCQPSNPCGWEANKFCDCGGACDWEKSDCEGFCPGYVGEDECCKTDNPCKLDENSKCNCGRHCEWDEKDCPVLCEGYKGTHNCCQDDDPCDWKNNAVCDCEGACEWDKDDCPDECVGYSGDNPCCFDNDPCGWAENGYCNCDASCLWDMKDCSEPDGDAELDIPACQNEMAGHLLCGDAIDFVKFENQPNNMEYYSCINDTLEGSEVVYSFTASCTGEIEISFWGWLGVRLLVMESCDPFSCIAKSEPSYWQKTTLTFEAVSGKDYILVFESESKETIELAISPIVCCKPCKGPCNPDDKQWCSSEFNACSCNTTTKEWEERDCRTICEENNYISSTGCVENEKTGDVSCKCSLDNCLTDAQCQNIGYDHCMEFDGTKTCVKSCSVVPCNGGYPCIDVMAPGDKSGICFNEQLAIPCSNVDESCGNDRYCNDLYGLWDTASCYPTCTAEKNTCPDGYVCYPLINRGGGGCVYHGQPNKPPVDGDEDLEAEMDNDIDDIEPDTEVEIDEDNEKEIEEEMEPLEVDVESGPCYTTDDCLGDLVCGPGGICVKPCVLTGCEFGFCNKNNGLCEYCDPGCGEGHCCNFSSVFWYCGQCCSPPCKEGWGCQSGECVPLKCPACHPSQECGPQTGYFCEGEVDGDAGRMSQECLMPNMDCIDGVDECCSGVCLMGTCL